MANLSTLTPIIQATKVATGALSVVSTAANGLANLIIASPQTTTGYQPQNPNSTNGQILAQGPSFVFNFEGEQSITLESDITDHYSEDNVAVQDQIALRPVIIETHGFIAELTDIPPAALALIQQVATKLTVIDAYVPEISATALLAYLNAFSLYQTGANAVNAAVSAWSSIANGPSGESVINGNSINQANNQTLQQQAFQTWWGYWQSRTLFTIQTPWAIFQNVAILKVKPVQDDTTETVTDFHVVFKQIRMVSSRTTGGLYTLGRFAVQSFNPATALGTQTPIQGPSLLSKTTSNYPGLL